MHLVRSQELAERLGRRTIDKSTFRITVVDHWVDNYTKGIIRSHVK